MSPAAASSQSLKAKALSALSRREHSRSELKAKLLRVCEDEPQVNALLDELQAKGWLNDARFVEARVHTRSSRFGNRRIEYELAQHGLKLDHDSAQALRQSELERARAVWARKFAQPAADAAERARQMRFLIARGFSSDVVRRVVQGAETD